MRSESIARYEDFADAEQAVDRLTEKGFAVENVRIIGLGLQKSEIVLPGYWSRAFAGLVAGALTGAAAGGAFFAFDLFAETVTLVDWISVSLLVGAVTGLVLSTIAHIGRIGQRRRIRSLGGMRPSEYELTIDADKMANAPELLHRPAMVDITEAKAEAL